MISGEAMRVKGVEPPRPKALDPKSSASASSATPADFLKSREDRIRTCDPLVPNQVLYQAELLPDKQKNYAPKRSRTPNLLIRSQTLYPVELWAHI